MKPNKFSGVTLEHGKDRRYARAAARRIGDNALKSSINAAENSAYSRLFGEKAIRVTDDDISSARMWGFILNYRFTEFKSDGGVVREIAERYARENIGGVATELEACHVDSLKQGLGAIVEGTAISAALDFTRRSVAAGMLADLSLK